MSDSDEYSYRNDQDSVSNKEKEDYLENSPDEQNNVKEKNFVVPTSKSKLQACRRCHLLKTQQQWVHEKCQNCMKTPQTTDKYSYIVSVIDVPKSWLKRKIPLPYGNRLVPGAYAVFLQ